MTWRLETLRGRFWVSGENQADENPRGFCEVPLDKNSIVCHNIEGEFFGVLIFYVFPGSRILVFRCFLGLG